LGLFANGEATDAELLKITERAFSKRSDQEEMTFPIVKLDDQIHILEAFNGVTGSFKVNRFAIDDVRINVNGLIIVRCPTCECCPSEEMPHTRRIALQQDKLSSG
jgi:hypothetical protein